MAKGLFSAIESNDVEGSFPGSQYRSGDQSGFGIGACLSDQPGGTCQGGTARYGTQEEKGQKSRIQSQSGEHRVKQTGYQFHGTRCPKDADDAQKGNQPGSHIPQGTKPPFGARREGIEGVQPEKYRRNPGKKQQGKE